VIKTHVAAVRAVRAVRAAWAAWAVVGGVKMTNDLGFWGA